MTTKTTLFVRMDERIVIHDIDAGHLADRRCPAESHRRRVGSRVFHRRVGAYSSVGSFSRGRRQISPLKSPFRWVPTWPRMSCRIVPSAAFIVLISRRWQQIAQPTCVSFPDPESQSSKSSQSSCAILVMERN